MATFTYAPDWGASPELEPGLRSVRFGDGYEQRATNGLNPILPTWKLQFTKRTQAEAQAIYSWMIANSAQVTAFDWAAPGEGTAAGELFGTGDGTRVTYSLVALSRPCTVVGTPTIYRPGWQGTQPLSPWPRTNLCLYSEQIDNAAWSKGTGVTVTSDMATAPDGTATADLVSYSGGGTSGGDRIFQTIAATIGQAYTVAIWLRSNTPVSLSLRNNQGGAQTITVTSAWQRFTLSGTAINAILQVWITGAPSDNSTFNIYAWGAQAEVGNTATAYIPTTTTPVTVTDYTLSGSLVTLAPTTNPVVSQNIGTGTGSLAAFTITTPNGTAPTVQNVWQTDWQGTYKMRTTARANTCWPSTPAPSTPWTMDASGTGVAPTITANYSTAPDGTMTATRVQMDKGAGAGFARLQGYSATVPSGKYCDSIFIKTNDGSYVSGVLRNGTEGQAISINGNWQRFSVSNASNTTTPFLQLLLWNTFGSSQTADLSVWGAQIETGDASQTIAPNHASISQSDYCAIATKDATKVRFVRPISDGQGFETCNPGARLARFVTNSRYLAIKLAYTGLVTRVDTYNAISWVLVDGVPYRGFSKIQGIGSSVTVVVEVFFPTEGTRTIEVPAPYCASVDFVGVDLEASAIISAAAARPSTRLLAMGDSITHGFSSSELIKSWPYLLGGLKSWQVINMGYGSRRCYPSDATNMAGLNPSVATYLIGYNDFGGQVALATFKSDYTAFINNFRALYPTVKLYCITPLATQTVLAIPIESYRQQIRDALTTLANPLNVLVEGTTLTDSGWSSFNADGIHPNDLGSAEIAAHLNSLVTP